MTYGEVDDAASRLAAWLVSQGIKPGDVVTLQFPNWAEFTIAYVACFKAGAVIQSLARNFNGADLTYAMNLVESRAYHRAHLPSTASVTSSRSSTSPATSLP